MQKIATLIAALAVASPAFAHWQRHAPTAPQQQLIPVFGQKLTDSIVLILTDSTAQCERLPREYRVHCLSVAYRDAAQEMRGHPDYDAARRPIEAAARKLEQIVKSTADSAAPKARLGRRTYTPIRKDAVPQAYAAARAAVEEAETLLLRASESSRDRQLHYTQIAQAVGSTKALLRS